MFAEMNPQWLTANQMAPEKTLDGYMVPASIPGPGLSEEYWRALGYQGPVSMNLGDGNYVPAPELDAWLTQNGYQQVLGPGQRAGFVDANGQFVPGSDYSTDTNDTPFMTAALLAGGLMGGAAAGAFGGAGAGTAGTLGSAGSLGTVGSVAPISTAGLTASELGSLGAGGLGAAGAGGATLPMAAGGSSFAWPEGMAALEGGAGGAGGAGVAGGAVGGGGMASSLIPGISNGTLLNVGGNALGAILGSQAASKASDAQIAAGQQSNALLKSMYDQTRADYAPYREAGTSALGQIQALLSNPNSITTTPGYQFGLDQGTKALNSGAAARGMTYSGAQGKALQRYGQDYAGTKLDQSFNRLASVAGLGQTATTGSALAGQNYGFNAGQTTQGMGNARASGYIGGANAWGGALGNALNNYNTDQLLNRLHPGYGG